jgi:thymidine kinase
VTANEAYELIVAKNKHLEAVACTEYPSRFVFVMVTKAAKAAGKTKGVLNSTYSVVKKTKEVAIYHPSDISLDEYFEGKEVESWNEKSAGENYVKHSADMMNGVFLGRKR